MLLENYYMPEVLHLQIMQYRIYSIVSRTWL